MTGKQPVCRAENSCSHRSSSLWNSDSTDRPVF